MLIVLVIVCRGEAVAPETAWSRLAASAPRHGSALLVLVLALGAAYRNAPRAKPDFAFDLPSLVEFVLIYLGNALTTGPLCGSCAGLVILAAGAASIWRLATERRIKETLLGSFSSSSRPSTR